MRCERCQQAGERHTVTMGVSTTTLMGVTPGYWDEDGNWVPPHDPNKTTTTYHCSNGHTWMETR